MKHHGNGGGPDSSHWGCLVAVWVVATVLVAVGLAVLSVRR